ncbi:MAG: PaREP1 family protein [Metallosphaera sp.]|uniref:PaREP1 domain-containing protein n=1 Tax=Metallosphaera cuprina (strain Ar-4) TaxID=1006006 RepID=F4FZ00_METCR|nr:PaREP1 family protein [Metallosphaera cuprina]AEB95570.1 PaREP1 domain-containing protein [Metallosphaera cuprina Ar-4]
MKLPEAIIEIGRDSRNEANDALEGKLSTDEIVKIRLDTANFYLERASEIVKTSHVLASEMLFKAIVEGIKALGDYFGLKKELRELPVFLTDILGEWVENAWEIGKRLHYDGYIFEFLQVDDVEAYVKFVKEFVKNCEIAVLY